MKNGNADDFIYYLYDADACVMFIDFLNSAIIKQERYIVSESKNTITQKNLFQTLWSWSIVMSLMIKKIV